jgi:hypothetical protein
MAGLDRDVAEAWLSLLAQYAHDPFLLICINDRLDELAVEAAHDAKRLQEGIGSDPTDQPGVLVRGTNVLFFLLAEPPGTAGNAVRQFRVVFVDPQDPRDARWTHTTPPDIAGL